MALTSTTVSLSSTSTLVDGRTPSQRAASPYCASPRTLPATPVFPQNRTQNRDSWKTTAHCRKIARNVMAMATGDSPLMATADAPAEVATELPETVKTIQKVWDKVEDKYAVSSLAVAGAVALWGSTGMISAIDRLPLVPGVLELVGIGYTGWFAYRNLVFKPEREALIAKIKETYREIIGSS